MDFKFKILKFWKEYITGYSLASLIYAVEKKCFLYKRYPCLIANEIVGVQPITIPTKSIFSFKYVYDSNTQNENLLSNLHT